MEAACTTMFMGSKSALELVVPLIDTLPRNNPLHATVAEFSTQIQNAYKEFKDLEKVEGEIKTAHIADQDQALATTEVPPPEWTYTSVDQKQTHNSSKKDAKQTVVSRYNALSQSLVNLRNDINKATSTALDDAEKIRRQDEVLSSYAWWTSMVLFAIGWGLGILAKVYGVDAPSGGAD